MKRTLSLFTSIALIMGTLFTSGCNQVNQKEDPPTIQKEEGLRVHAILNSEETQAWHLWQSIHDENFVIENPKEKYFFLPTSADDKTVDIYNAYSVPVTLNGVSIDSHTTQSVSYDVNTPYEVIVNDETITLTFMKSNAEAAVFINNDNADGNGADLFAYLNDDNENKDKSRTATATGAILDADGHIDNTSIKKIKGRGNTSWYKSKKSYNVTYESAVSVGGMTSGKKYSLIANYQDDSLSRNRFLFDLSDAVGIPYASDSRYTDLYINGFYCGSYQMCEKINTGKKSLVNDIQAIDFLNDDGTVKSDFPFLCVIDPSVDEKEDYYVETDGGILTIKYPELTKGDTGYEEVKSYVAEKYNTFYAAASNNNLSEYSNLDSLAKVFLINELGKNWDSGVSSLFFVYKPDESGEFKFFGSPVWDYDNSL